MKNKEIIGFVTDEVGDIPEEMANENKISIVKYKIDFQELSEIPGNIYQKIREGERMGIKNLLIKTSQPSINDFLSVFKEKLKKFEEVLCITFSSKISGAYNSALQAKKFLEKELQNKVHVFDSQRGTSCEGLLVLKAVELAKEKFSINDIISSLTKEIPNIKMLAMYKNSRWLEASGRFPSFGNAIINRAEKMDIKPIFGFKNGKLSIVAIKRNIKEISITLFEEFEKATKNIRETGKKIKVAIAHADDIEQAEKLKKMILNLKNTEIAFVNLVCFPIGGHTGPGTIILSWNQ
ncbi:MAG: DegV family protein [Candidatus Paceibacterota bacterium]|jgi:DegV family protein with EDD domain